MTVAKDWALREDDDNMATYICPLAVYALSPVSVRVTKQASIPAILHYVQHEI
jgi:hypothetical protein